MRTIEDLTVEMRDSGGLVASQVSMLIATLCHIGSIRGSGHSRKNGHRLLRINNA